jgi:hypothetical protein
VVKGEVKEYKARYEEFKGAVPSTPNKKALYREFKGVIRSIWNRITSLTRTAAIKFRVTPTAAAAAAAADPPLVNHLARTAAIAIAVIVYRGLLTVNTRL